MNRLLSALLVSAALAGCASTGTMVTEQQASQFQRGVATRDQVIGKLGAPNSSSTANDGSRIDVYYHLNSHADVASFIPVVGLLAGGASGTSNSAIFTYDTAGLLKTVSTSTGQTDVKTGLLNQK